MKKSTLLLSGLVLMLCMADGYASNNESGNSSRVAKKAAIQAKRAQKKAELEAKKAQAQSDAEQKRAEREAKKEQAKADMEQKKAEREAKAAQAEQTAPEGQQKIAGTIDGRQANQEKRIQHGISKGYLTESEITKLNNQEKAISDLEASCKSDGKLTRSETKSLREAINTASVNIWAEKHDTEGKQMPTYRLGKNVFAKDSLTTVLSRDDLDSPDARRMLRDFRRMIELKKQLSAGTGDTKKHQSEFDELLNKYFDVK